MINSLQFHLRYKAAELVVSRYLYDFASANNIIDLTLLKHLTADDGLYLGMMTPVMELTRLSESQLDDSDIIDYIKESKMLFLDKVKLDGGTDVDRQIKDTEAYKFAIYDTINKTYFLALSLTALNPGLALDDGLQSFKSSFVPINAFTVFDDEIITTVSQLLDFSCANKQLKQVIDEKIKADKILSAYSSYLSLLDGFGLN